MRTYRDRYSGKKGLIQIRENAFTASTLTNDDHIITIEDGVYKFIPWNAEVKGAIVEYTIYKAND